MACIVKGCKSHSSRKENHGSNKYIEENTNERLTFHLFPKDENIKSKWKELINRSTDWEPKAHTHLCSKHFTDDAFVPNENIKWRRLKADAVPTLYLPQETDTDTLELLSDRSYNIETSTQLPSTQIHPTATMSKPLKRKISVTHRGVNTDIEESTPTSRPFLTSCGVNTDVEQVSTLKKIQLLEKKLQTVERTSKRRLQKINSLRKKVVRLSKINKDLYNTVTEKVKQENT